MVRRHHSSHRGDLLLFAGWWALLVRQFWSATAFCPALALGGGGGSSALLPARGWARTRAGLVPSEGPTLSLPRTIRLHVLPPSDSAFDYFSEDDDDDDDEEMEEETAASDPWDNEAWESPPADPSVATDDGLDGARRYYERLLLLSRSPFDDHHPLCAEAGAETDPHQEALVTSAMRYRRQLEVQLLAQLEDGDEAVDTLMHLWMYETSFEDGQSLQAMEESCSPGLVEEQRALRAMIQRHPQWVEPQVRLATLLFFKGHTREAYMTAVRAYRRKPHHFELVPLLVMLSLRQQRFGKAVRWARHGLPPLSRPNQRRKWVRHAVSRAQSDLDEQAARDDDARRKRASAADANTGTGSPFLAGGSPSAWQ